MTSIFSSPFIISFSFAIAVTSSSCNELHFYAWLHMSKMRLPPLPSFVRLMIDFHGVSWPMPNMDSCSISHPSIISPFSSAGSIWQDPQSSKFHLLQNISLIKEVVSIIHLFMLIGIVWKETCWCKVPSLHNWHQVSLFAISYAAKHFTIEISAVQLSQIVHIQFFDDCK